MEQQQTEAGWYDHDRGLRYWDGGKWTDNYHPGFPDQPTQKTMLWGLSLGFGVAGGVGVIAIPLLAFYFPLGLGAAGAALAIAAVTTKGETPWWAIVAVLASIAGIATGISAYNEFQDQTEQAQEAIDGLNNFAP